MTHKLTRLISMMLAVIMTFSMLLIPVEAASFNDVSDQAWYKAAVDYVHERGWMAGTSEYTFEPTVDVTRGMFVTVLARFAEAKTDNGQPAFADTPAGKWYTGAAAWAAKEGVVSGIGANSFAPNRPITRQDLCTVLAAYLRVKGIELTRTQEKSFTDEAAIASYAKDPVALCASVGLIAGFDDGSFRPKQTATRAQLAQIIMRLDLLIRGEEAPTDPMPAQSFAAEQAGDMTVSVEAPQGALPENTTMSVSPVTDEAVLTTLAVHTRNRVLAAADISFAKDGVELEPQKEVAVEISMDGLAQLACPTVVHFSDAGVVERVSSELVSRNRDGSDKALRFYAKDFSVYAILDDATSDDARLKVQFMNPVFAADGTYTLEEGYSVFITKHDVVNTDGANGAAYNYLPTTIADPTVSEPTGTLMFCGWSFHSDYTDREVDGQHTITYIRDELAKLLKGETNDAADSSFVVAEGSEIKVYPILFNFYTVTYKDELGDTALKTVGYFTKEKETEITVDGVYDPYSAGYEHIGWTRMDTQETIENQENTVISGNLVLKAAVAQGYWLTFVEAPGEKAHYKGATYNPPVFCPQGVIPADARPADPTLPGFTFGGWFTSFTEGASASNDTWGSQFNFSQTLTENTSVYAKWTMLESVPYTVVLWKQTVDDDKNAADADKTYDYAFSTTLYAAPNTPISSLDLSYYKETHSYTSSTGSTYSNYINTKEDGSGTWVYFYGFQFNSARGAVSSNSNVTTVLPNGTTVINLYWDRELVSYSFYTKPYIQYTGTKSSSLLNGSTIYYFYHTTYGYCPLGYYNSSYQEIYYPTTASSSEKSTQYCIVDGTMYELEWDTDSSGSAYYWWYQDSSENWHTYDGIRYYYYGYGSYTSYAWYTQSSDWIVRETYTGLYGQRLTKAGYTWPTDYRWYLGIGSNSFISISDIFSSSSNTNPTDEYHTDLYGYVESFDSNVYHYLMDSAGNWPTEADHEIPTKIGNGMIFRDFQGFSTYNFRIKLPDGVTSYTYGTTYTNGLDDNGAAKADSDGNYTFSDSQTGTTTDGWTKWLPYGTGVEYSGNSRHELTRWNATEGGIEFRYSRNRYRITYMVGAYVDGNGVAISGPKEGELHRSGSIYYEASIDPYKQGGASYYDPVAAGDFTDDSFVFAGWYSDPSCTTPYDFTGKTMPLNGMTVYAKFIQREYRVFLKDNAPAGAEVDLGENQQSDFRRAYLATLNQNGEYINITDKSGQYAFVGWYWDEALTQPVNFSTQVNDDHATDYPDSEKLESDKTRPGVTKKITIYAKWRRILEGANGIHVRYDADSVPANPIYHGAFADGSTIWIDGQVYTDGAQVYARSASIPGTEDFQFLYWEILDKEGNGTGKIVYPGQEFNIDFDYVTVKDNTSHVTHTLSHVEAKAANCGYEGNVEYWKCTVCGKLFLDAGATQETNKEAVKTPIDGEHAPDGTYVGYPEGHAQHCTVCGKSVEGGEHTEDTGTVTKEPTATEEGTKEYRCTVCNYLVRTETIPATGSTTYTVTYSVPADVTTPDAATVNKGASVTLPTGLAKVGDYTFVGWVADQNATTNTNLLTGTYTPTANITLYALYSKTTGGSGDVSWVAITSASELVEGTYVITWDNAYYLPSETTAAKNPAVGTGITVADGKLTNTVSSSMQWTFEADSANGFNIHHTSGTTTYYLGAKNTAQGIQITTTDPGVTGSYAYYNSWKATDNSDLGLVLNSSDGGSRYLSVYDNGSWRYYQTSNYSGTLRLYKQTSSSSGGTTTYTTNPGNGGNGISKPVKGNALHASTSRMAEAPASLPNVGSNPKPVTANTGTYKKVSAFTAGKKYLIVYTSGSDSYVLTNANGSYGALFTSTTITANGSVYTVSGTDIDSYQLEAAASGSGFTLKTSDGNYLGISSYYPRFISSDSYYWVYSNSYITGNSAYNLKYYNGYLDYATYTSGSSFDVYELVENSNYTVSFKDYDGTALTGSAYDDQTVSTGDKVTAPTATPTREGYTFVCWRYQAADGYRFDFDYVIGTDFTPSGDFSLYACYEKNVTESSVWVPYTESTIDTSKEYLIGIHYNDKVYLVASENPRSIDYYYYAFYSQANSSDSSYTNKYYLGYQALAAMTGDRITGISDEEASANLDYYTWKFSSETGGQISSVLDANVCLNLKGSTNTTTKVYEYDFLPYPSDLFTPSSDWEWNAESNTLKTASYYLTTNSISYTDGPTYQIDFGSTSAPTDTTIQLYVKEETPVDYTVTFKANGGAGEDKTQTVTSGSATQLQANTFTREGYSFSGWNTKADGSGTAYADGASVTLSGDLTLYAQWQKVETWYPTDTLVDGEEYLIGYKAADGKVYLIMNYNPDAKRYYFASENYYWYSYGVQALLDGDNVIGVDTSAYASATLNYASWKVAKNGNDYFTFQSKQNASYYLGAYTSTGSYTDLYPFTSSNSAGYTNWQWDAENHNLKYVNGTTLRYVTYVPTVDSTANFFHAPTTADASYSKIQLYSKTAKKVTVIFVDSLVSEGEEGYELSKQEKIVGQSAAAPVAPIHEGYLFDGWEGSYTNVTEDTVVKAKYTAAGPFTVTFMNGDQVYQTQTVNAQAYATRPETDPSYTGDEEFTFKEWQYEGQTFDFTHTRITGNITLTAAYTALEQKTYTMTLRAVYGPKQTVVKTHVTWYADNPDNAHTDSEPVLFNAPIAILDPNSLAEFENPGYAFVGWARLPEAEADKVGEYEVVTEDGTIIKYSDLAEDEVWLRYNGADDTHAEPYFTVKVNGKDVVVTHIAANENKPYHGLYAVWKARNTFYVLHSATGKLEAFSLPVNQTGSSDPASLFETIDLTARVTDGYLYGGYYKAYGGVDATALEALTTAYETVNQTGWTKAPANSDYLASYDLMDAASTVSFEAYTAESLKAGTREKFFTRANAYKVGEADSGNALKPIAGEIYYLKEVPNSYLQPKVLYVTDDNQEDQMIYMYLVTVIDDTLYRNAGFKVREDEIDVIGALSEELTSGAVSAQFTLARKPKDGETETPAQTVTVNAGSFGLARGYVAVAERHDLVGASKMFTQLPTWETLDGVLVSYHPCEVENNENNTETTLTRLEMPAHLGNERLYIYTGNTWLDEDHESAWDKDDAVTKIYFMVKASADAEASETMIVDTVKIGDHLYAAQIPAGDWNYLLLLRCNPQATGEFDWNYKDYWWNQTADWTLSDTNNYISSFAAKDMEGSAAPVWSVYVP